MFQDIVQLRHIHTQSLAAFTPIDRTDYRDLPSFKPVNAKGEVTGPDRFSHTDGFIFSHIAVTPTPSWGYITAADVPVGSVVGMFAGYNHSSKYLMSEHDAAVAGGMGVLQG